MGYAVGTFWQVYEIKTCRNRRCMLLGSHSLRKYRMTIAHKIIYTVGIYETQHLTTQELTINVLYSECSNISAAEVTPFQIHWIFFFCLFFVLLFVWWRSHHCWTGLVVAVGNLMEDPVSHHPSWVLKFFLVKTPVLSREILFCFCSQHHQRVFYNQLPEKEL